VSRAPTVDELWDIFLDTWSALDKEDPERPRRAMAAVKDAVLLGAARAGLRARVRERANRRPAARARLGLVKTDAVVLDRVAQAGGLEVAQLLRQDRSQSVSRWRRRAMWALHHGRDRSPSEVSAVVRRNRSTVIHGIQRVDAEVAADPALGAKLLRLGA